MNLKFEILLKLRLNASEKLCKCIICLYLALVLNGASVVRGLKDFRHRCRHICRRHFGRVVRGVLRQKDVM